MKKYQFFLRSGLATLTALFVLGLSAGCGASSKPEGNIPEGPPMTQEERDANAAKINSLRGGYGNNIPGAKNAGKGLDARDKKAGVAPPAETKAP